MDRLRRAVRVGSERLSGRVGGFVVGGLAIPGVFLTLLDAADKWNLSVEPAPVLFAAAAIVAVNAFYRESKRREEAERRAAKAEAAAHATPDEPNIRRTFDDLYQRGAEVTFPYEFMSGAGDPAEQRYGRWIEECNDAIRNFRPNFSRRFRDASDLTKSVLADSRDAYTFQDRVRHSREILKELAEEPLS